MFHNSARVPFTIVANETTWVNLTVVRQEEVLGTVSTPKGDPVEDAVGQFLLDGTLEGATETDDEEIKEWIENGSPYINFIANVGSRLNAEIKRREKVEQDMSEDVNDWSPKWEDTLDLLKELRGEEWRRP